MEPKTTEWRPGPAVCRCCLTEGCYKDISTEYFWMGKREVYAEMLSETLDLTIAYSKSGGPNSNSRLICEQCISRLRDAADFKRQVQECERTFMQCLDPGSSTDITVSIEPLDPDVKLEQVKQEKRNSDAEDAFDDQPDFGDDDDDYDELDDQPLMKFASKTPKEESVDLLDLLDNAKPPEKRKSTIKIKNTAKKAKTKKEKATSSKPKPEKKKKDSPPASRSQKAKWNAEVVLEYSTVYPFRLRGKSLMCVYCCEEFDDPKEYRQHMDDNHKTFTVSTAFAHKRDKEYLKVDCTNLKCKICGQYFVSLEEIAKHIRNIHDVKRIDLNYDIGMQPFKIDVDRWICVLCNKKFPSITKLCRHTTSHYLKYTCDVCGRSYLTNEALKYHIRCSHSGTQVCRKCWQDFPTLESKREHIKQSKACWPFCCVSCGERFQSWELKQKHLVEAHGRPKRTYICPDCEETFDSRKLFYSHYTLNHTDEGFECPDCGMKFGSKKQLADHKLVHSGEKQFRCNICLKKLSRKKSLQQHMWLHSENKPFSCVICQKQFAQKVSLKVHLRSHDLEVSTMLK